MKRYILLIVLIIIGVAVWLKIPLVKAYYNRWSKFSFCDKPVTYKIGKIDPRFKIADSKVRNDINQAASVWNEIAGYEIFTYDPESDLDINLVYDERQISISNINKKRKEIEAEKAKYEAELLRYETEKARVEAKLAELNQEIQYWNSQGGAPIDIYEDLIYQQEKVQQEINKVNEMTEMVNRTTDRINSEIDSINKKVNDFNKLLSDLPEEGLYIGSENRIEIYIYDSPESFGHTVAHELGHALGLDHVDEVDAILYPVSSPNSEIKKADIEAFNNFCQEQDRLDLVKSDLKVIWQMLFSEMQDMLPLRT